MTRDVLLAPADNIRLVELCGPLDEHLHLIEARLGVEVRRRGNRFQIIGLPAAIKRAEQVLQGLYMRRSASRSTPNACTLRCKSWTWTAIPTPIRRRMN